MTSSAVHASSINSLDVKAPIERSKQNTGENSLTYRAWTLSDDEQLRQLWMVDKKSEGDIGAIMGRTRNSVSGRISYLKLRVENRLQYHPWTMGDRFTLRAMWKMEASIATIARALNVSDKVVRREAAKLKLPSRKVKVQREKTPRKRKSLLIERGEAKPAKGVQHKGKICDLPSEPNPSHGMFFLPRNRCQWIANKLIPGSGDRQKCGEQVVHGRPYCPDHEARVWRPREEREAA